MSSICKSVLSPEFWAGFEWVLHFALLPYTTSIYSGLEGLGFRVWGSGCAFEGHAITPGIGVV